MRMSRIKALTPIEGRYGSIITSFLLDLGMDTNGQ